jgi:hypothetical protein
VALNNSEKLDIVDQHINSIESQVYSLEIALDAEVGITPVELQNQDYIENVTQQLSILNQKLSIMQTERQTLV